MDKLSGKGGRQIKSLHFTSALCQQGSVSQKVYTLGWCPKFCRCHQGTPLQHLVLVAKGFCLQFPQDCNQWGLCSRSHETKITEETITGKLLTTEHWTNKTDTHTLSPLHENGLGAGLRSVLAQSPAEFFPATHLTATSASLQPAAIAQKRALHLFGAPVCATDSRNIMVYTRN